MKNPQVTNQQLLRYARTYWQWRFLWLATTVAFAALGVVYALFLKTDTWVASQGLIVRDEANGAVMRLGRFQSQTEMKAAQETILEMAGNPQVLGDALGQVGRDSSWWSTLPPDAPPTSAEIEELAKYGLEVRAPRGAELGTTEVIYLDVKQDSRTRAFALNTAICDALEARLQQVRKVRADGVIAELVTTKAAAQKNLDEATRQLRKMEGEAGPDLSDLRGLTDTVSGGSSNRQQLDTIKNELRQAELQLQQLRTDLQLASDSFENPDQLLLTPNQMVTSHPALRKLREGLADASIVSSQLQGKFTPRHPLVIAALETEVKIRDQLRGELGVSVEALRKDIDIAVERVSKLREQQSQLELRLENIARIRADYSNLVTEVRARSQQLQESERELAQAEASRQAALTSSLITRLDEPILGESPIGPGRTTIVAGATVGGLFFGLGIVFLLTPLDSTINYGRRQFDYSGLAGRRASDVPTKEPVARPVETPASSLSSSGSTFAAAAMVVPTAPAGSYSSFQV